MTATRTMRKGTRRMHATKTKTTTTTTTTRHLLATTTLLLVTFASFTGVEGFSSGPGSCDAKGGHGTTASDGAAAGYSLTTTAGTVAPGEQITLTLAAPAGGASDFRGFIFTADDGTLAVENGLTARAVSSCSGAVGHRSAALKSSVQAGVIDDDDMTSTRFSIFSFHY